MTLNRLVTIIIIMFVLSTIVIVLFGNGTTVFESNCLDSNGTVYKTGVTNFSLECKY